MHSCLESMSKAQGQRETLARMLTNGLTHATQGLQ